ncbi:MAG TPA: AbrB/MazE/SpoVT family DNA-binding domain-containing protein [Gammaproteobacteria bacterium]|nr:AbrB/MazE/SpoVT family DNA-binding domain-containing protein [Gammaproteobacteria bacterium]
MSSLTTTRMSSKGQIVIPEEIRQSMGLHTGDQFIAVAENDVVILKRLSQPSVKQFSGLISKIRKQAKKAGLSKKVLADAIKGSRKKNESDR